MVRVKVIVTNGGGLLFLCALLVWYLMYLIRHGLYALTYKRVTRLIL